MAFNVEGDNSSRITVLTSLVAHLNTTADYSQAIVARDQYESVGNYEQLTAAEYEVLHETAHNSQQLVNSNECSALSAGESIAIEQSTIDRRSVQHWHSVDEDGYHQSLGSDNDGYDQPLDDSAGYLQPLNDDGDGYFQPLAADNYDENIMQQSSTNTVAVVSNRLANSTTDEILHTIDSQPCTSRNFQNINYNHAAENSPNQANVLYEAQVTIQSNQRQRVTLTPVYQSQDTSTSPLYHADSITPPPLSHRARAQNEDTAVYEEADDQLNSSFGRTWCVIVSTAVVTTALCTMVIVGILDSGDELLSDDIASSGFQTYREIFSGHRDTPWNHTGATTAFQYNNIDYNNELTFNGSHFQPRSDGVFFIYLSHPMSNSSSVLNVTLVNSEGLILQRLYVLATDLSCSFAAHSLVRLRHAQSLHAVSKTAVSHINSHQRPTLIGFRADATSMMPFVACQIDLLVDPNIKHTADVIHEPIFTYDNSNFMHQINENWNFSLKNTAGNVSSFKVPVNGIYVMSITATFSLPPPKSIREFKLGFGFESTRVYTKSLLRNGASPHGHLMQTFFYLVKITTEELVLLLVALPRATLSITMMLYSPVNTSKVACSMLIDISPDSIPKFKPQCFLDVSENVDATCCNTYSRPRCVDDTQSVRLKESGLFYIALTVDVYPRSLDCVLVEHTNGTVTKAMCVAIDHDKDGAGMFQASVHRSSMSQLSAGSVIRLQITPVDTSKYLTKQILFACFLVNFNNATAV